jgi:hypothetical protein
MENKKYVLLWALEIEGSFFVLKSHAYARARWPPNNG